MEKDALVLWATSYRHISACIKGLDNDEDGILYNRAFINLLSHGKYALHEPTEMGKTTRRLLSSAEILQDFSILFRTDFEPSPAVPCKPNSAPTRAQPGNPATAAEEPPTT